MHFCKAFPGFALEFSIAKQTININNWNNYPYEPFSDLSPFQICLLFLRKYLTITIDPTCESIITLTQLCVDTHTCSKELIAGKCLHSKISSSKMKRLPGATECLGLVRTI